MGLKGNLPAPACHLAQVHVSRLAYHPRKDNVFPMTLKIEIEREDNGRWIAEVPALPGCLCYGVTKDDAVRSTEALALRILAERCESGDDSFARDAFAVPA